MIQADIIHLDVLNKQRTPSNKPPNDMSCLVLLQAIFPNFVSLNPAHSSTRSAPNLPPITSGSRISLPRMLGAMRELIVRHSAVNYGRLLNRCLERLVSLGEAKLSEPALRLTHAEGSDTY